MAETEFAGALLMLVFLGVPVGGVIILFLKWILSGSVDVSGYGHD